MDSDDVLVFLPSIASGSEDDVIRSDLINIGLAVGAIT
jgi:hypothetical protein